MRPSLTLAKAACLATLVFYSFIAVHGQSTEILYQGKMAAAPGYADGHYDFIFGLFNAETGGTALGSISRNFTPVREGAFTVALEFGAGVFNGESRWLSISVRTNGTSAYIELTPRQKIAAAPVALYAPSAGTASVAAGVAPGSINSVSLAAGAVTTVNIADSTITQADLSGPLSSNVMHLNGLIIPGMTANPQTNRHTSLWLTNGMVGVPTWNSANPGLGILPRPFDIPPGLIFFDDNPGEWHAQITCWGNHNGGSPNTPELLLWSANNIAIVPGNNGIVGSGHVQLGGSGPGHETFGFQYDDNIYTPGWSDGLGTQTRGHSKRVQFIARSWDDLNTNGVMDSNEYFWSYPGIVGFSGGPGAPLYDHRGAAGTLFSKFGELGFYTASPVYWNNTFASTPGVMMGKMMTNGWDLRGRLIQESRAASASSGTVELHLGQAPHIRLNLAGGTCSFVTANPLAAPTNYVRVVFHIRTSASAILNTPNWIGRAMVPNTLSAMEMLRLELEAVGAGEANVTVVDAKLYPLP